jgi:dienelactone hydrolase
MNSTLSPLAVGESVKAWKRERAQIRARWMALLGDFSPSCELNARVMEEFDGEGYKRFTVCYRTIVAQSHIEVNAFLFVPNEMTEPCPAVIVFHQTTNQTIFEPAGMAGPPSLHTALHLVERGYVVLCPRNYIWDYDGHSNRIGQPSDYHAVAHRLAEEFPNWTGMGRMLWDGLRSVDYLTTLDIVDSRRIGCFGFSLGAKEALYLAAFDERIQAAVAIEGGVGLSFSNWDAPWYLGAKRPLLDSGMDHNELLALVAPRAFFLVGGNRGPSEEDGQVSDGADSSRSWPYVESVRPVY